MQEEAAEADSATSGIRRAENARPKAAIRRQGTGKAMRAATGAGATGVAGAATGEATNAPRVPRAAGQYSRPSEPGPKLILANELR